MCEKQYVLSHLDKLLKGNASRQCPGEARKLIGKVMKSPANNPVIKTKRKESYVMVLFICSGFVFGLDYCLVLFSGAAFQITKRIEQYPVVFFVLLTLEK